MNYPDTILLATVSTDGYGDKTVTSYDQVNASFINRSGYQHSNNIDGIVSSATVYLDHEDEVVLSKIDNLEGMYIKFNDEWFRIESRTIAVRKLLDNTIENVHCILEKAAGVAYDSVS